MAQSGHIETFLMSLAFCLLGVSALLLAISLWPRLHTRGGRIGSWWLLIIGAAFFVAGAFPPVQTPLIIGYLHGISGLVAIFGSPIAFTLIGRSLASNEPAFLLSHRMRTTLAAWGGLGLFLASLTVRGSCMGGGVEATLLARAKEVIE